MPFILQVDHESGKARATATGVVTLEEIRSHLDEEFRRSGLAYRELIDATGATLAISAQEAWNVVELLRSYGRTGALGPTAVIVADELSYGMCRMIGILLDDVCELRPFRASDRAAAEQWLAAAPVAPAQA